MILDEKQSKRIIVADFLHHHIPISNLEKKVMSNEVFNRLHNVLQNSTLYLTYPSNRTSRFSHSLGCMHIAGEIFVNGIVNARYEHKKDFFNELSQEIVRLHSVRDLPLPLPTLSLSLDDLLDTGLDRLLQETHYKTIPLPHNIISLSTKVSDEEQEANIRLNNQFCYAFLLTYQAIRLAALLHDVGHPPFSHITERAFEEIVVLVRTQVDDSPTKDEFLAIVNKNAENRFREDAATHEMLGYDLSVGILRSVSTEDNEENFDSFIISNMALFILREHSSLYMSLHKIMDGDLDADRLDYTPRESKISGLDSGVPEYERLLGSFQLFQVQINDKKVYTFLPSVRALRTVEDLFRQRHLWYKYVIYHHRVVKTDGLLRNAVVLLAKEYFTENNNKTDNNDNLSNLLPTDISGLWKILRHSYASVIDDDTSKPPKVRSAYKEYLDTYFDYLKNRYIQWDDSWLLGVLRKSYFSNEIKSPILKTQIYEILSNKKSYHSLYKRLDGFKHVDKAFWISMSEDTSEVVNNLDELLLRKVEEAHPNLSEDVRVRIAVSLERFQPVIKAIGTDYEHVSNDIGVVLSILFRAVKEAGGPPLDFVHSAVQDMANASKGKIIDAFCEIKILPLGIKPSFKLIGDDGVINISDVSGIVNELEQSCNLSPPMYVYIFPEDKFVSDGLTLELQGQLGKLIWKSFSKWIMGEKEQEK